VGLLWDDDNRDHVEGHGIARGEIEALHASAAYAAMEDPDGDPTVQRWIGPGHGRTLITVAVQWWEIPNHPDGGRWRPITAWPATAAQARFWREELGEESGPEGE
jgi:hypothetical protein